ncbi:MAG: LPS export ABC transporter permease LptF [Pseudomonadota bacterium]
MRRLDRYILRQCLAPLAFAVTVVTLVVWLTQSLQRLDVLVEDGSSFASFASISILIIPSLLSVIIPFALFAAALFALHRMHADSEIAVMFAAGVSPWRLAAPLLAVTAVAAAATLWVNVDLMPRSYRALKQIVADVRADFATAVVRSGEFTTIVDGFTIYVDEVRPGGRFLGVLINDYRNRDRVETYMAQKGLLRDTDDGPVLFLANGNAQLTNEQGEIDVVPFDETAVNVDEYGRGAGPLQLELTERYLSELFNPDLDNAWDRENVGKLAAEGHNRLASPLYAFAYVLLAIQALVSGAYSRRGYAARIAVACAVAGGLRIAGFVAQSAAAGTGANWLQYLVPGGACVALAVLISLRRPPRFTAPRSAAALGAG